MIPWLHEKPLKSTNTRYRSVYVYKASTKKNWHNGGVTIVTIMLKVVHVHVDNLFQQFLDTLAVYNHSPYQTKQS